MLFASILFLGFANDYSDFSCRTRLKTVELERDRMSHEVTKVLISWESGFFCWENQFIAGNTDYRRMALHYAIICQLERRIAQPKVFFTIFCSYEKNSEPLILHSLKRLKTWSTITRNLWKGMCCMSDSWDSFRDSLESMLIYPQRINQRWSKLEWKTNMLKCIRLPAKVMRSTGNGALNRKCHRRTDVLQWQR